MLLQFTVGNFLSIKEKQTFSMQATAIEELESNYTVVNNHRILKTAVIYGANSSGKSNLIKAFGFFVNTIFNSVKLNSDDELKYTPFLLSSETENAPTHFEIIYLAGNEKIKYGFEYSKNKIEKEWLVAKVGKGAEHVLFARDSDGIAVNDKKFKEGIDKESQTNDNRLFLSLVAQLNGKISKDIIEWIQKHLRVASGLKSDGYGVYSKRLLLKDKAEAGKIVDLFKKLNFGFESLLAKEVDIDPSWLDDVDDIDLKNFLKKDLEGKKNIEIYSTHNKYDNGKIVGQIPFDFAIRESEGTKKFFDISGLIINALDRGAIFVIDELDAKLHPLITEFIIRLFNDPETNPNNAQLIFNTHDSFLLSLGDLFRRDQIWFTEKNPWEQTEFYRMTDIKFPDGSIPRKDSNYKNNYFSGRYGAIPFIRK